MPVPNSRIADLLNELMGIPGLGPKRVRALHGFGAKTEEKILSAIAQLKTTGRPAAAMAAMVDYPDVTEVIARGTKRLTVRLLGSNQAPAAS